MKITLPSFTSLSGRTVNKLFMTILTIGAIYMAAQVLLTLRVQPNQAYIEEQTKKLQEEQVRFDPKTAEEVKSLLHIPVTVGTGSPGKNDPFN